MQASVSRLLLISAALSVGLLVALLGAYFVYQSNLALAQAADSFTDVLTAALLGWAVHIGSKPPDEGHPFGHHNAQPIAALVVAVLAGVLAIAVVRVAIEALLTGVRPQLEWPVAFAFVLKLLGRFVIMIAARPRQKSQSSVMAALRMDARNDVLVSLLALGGFMAARYGMPSLDMWLALPVGAWVGVSGVFLAWENIRLLMGEAPELDRQRQLIAIAAADDRVRSVSCLKARYHGDHLALWLEIGVDRNLTIGVAHDIGEEVEARLLEQSDVVECVVHVDADRES
ncbi:MAG: cation diffusion facilitator family transporter [Myxococcota bacterium]